jgi:hypothetical protein
MAGFRFPVGERDFFLFHSIQTGSGAHQNPIKWVPEGLFPGVKRPVLEDDHSPPSSAKVKNVELNLYSPTGLHGAALN